MIDYSAQGGVDAGDLRMRVLYQTLGEGEPSPYGDSAQVWTNAGRLAALVEELEGNELLKARQMHEQAKVRVTIRYNSAVNTAGRFVYQGQNYYLASAVPDPLKRKMVCTCYLQKNEQVN
jgi:SPP1 family predicted phage head-tail adaptor